MLDVEDLTAAPPLEQVKLQLAQLRAMLEG
jgi:hypothetical protein